jgi:segregation and condensation protein B
MARRSRTDEFDRQLAELPQEFRRREFMGRIEAVLFATAGAVTREDLSRVVADDCSIDSLIDDIRQELKTRPYDIAFAAGGYRIQTKPRYADVLRAMVSQWTPQLSKSDTVLLAAISYFQPVTRSRLCSILSRNVTRDAIARLKVAQLVDNGPRSPQPGAPMTYVTTKAFLELFGFGSLNDLPDFEALQAEGALAEPDLGDEMREILGIEDDDRDTEDEGD